MASELVGMVLRCDTTGKLFYSHKEAEVHGDETGLKDFSQVSLDEKVWVCNETKKVCFNSQQIDLHKRRVPEAQTFEEMSIGELKKWQQDAAAAAAAAASSAPAEMETEDEQLLREAGLSGKMARLNARGSQPLGAPILSAESVAQLVEMGFSELRAQKALINTDLSLIHI